MRDSRAHFQLSRCFAGRDLSQGVAHVSADGAQGLLRTSTTNGTKGDQDLRGQPRSDAQRGRSTCVRLQVHEPSVERRFNRLMSRSSLTCTYRASATEMF